MDTFNIIIIIYCEQMFQIGAAASKRLKTTIKLDKSKIIQQKKSCGVAAPEEKHEILTTSTYT